MRPIVSNKGVKFGDLRLKHSREIPLLAVGYGIVDSFFCDNFRPDVVSDVLSGAAIGYVNVDVSVKLDDSTLNIGQIVRPFAGRTRFTHFCAVFNYSLRPTDDMSGISGRFVRLTVPNEPVKFRDPRLNRSGDIRPKAEGGGIFGRLFR